MADDNFSFLSSDSDNDDNQDTVESPTDISTLIPPAWMDFMSPFFNTAKGQQLVQFINETYSKLPNTTCPPKDKMFRAFQFVSPNDIKVVILGQDPYHSKGVANGLAFSCNGPSLQPSLKNMFKELKTDLNIDRTEGNLEDWAKQGVLLMNCTLMVQHGKANSYEQQWKDFAPYVLRKLMRDHKQIVFLIWGGNAKRSIRPFMQFKAGNQHVVLEAAHPSPLSAHNGFFGTKPFSKANTALMQMGKMPIMW